MSQSKINVTGLNSKADGDKLVQAAEGVTGVKMINANHEAGFVVVTHGENFDESKFKEAIIAAGFSA